MDDIKRPTNWKEMYSELADTLEKLKVIARGYLTKIEVLAQENQELKEERSGLLNKIREYEPYFGLDNEPKKEDDVKSINYLVIETFENVGTRQLQNRMGLSDFYSPF